MEKRRYCATKLVGKLRGPARLLATSWTTMEFDHVNGAREFLQRLAASPLVRQTLPNAAAICQQYFGFRRDAGEAMNSFLVREALGYSEFVETLLLLHEDKLGIKQHEKTFDLPEEQPADYYQYDYDDWWGDQWWSEEPALEQPDESSQAAETAAAPARTEAGDGSLGASLHRRMQTPSASSQRRGSQGVDGPPPGFEPLDEFSMADSFVLGVLRGFRLLQAAGLNAEEKRDILSATKGNLEFEVVTQALQTLWDEQFLGRRSVFLELFPGGVLQRSWRARLQ